MINCLRLTDQARVTANLLHFLEPKDPRYKAYQKLMSELRITQESLCDTWDALMAEVYT